MSYSDTRQVNLKSTKLVEKAKMEKFECDIFSDFQTMFDVHVSQNRLKFALLLFFMSVLASICEKNIFSRDIHKFQFQKK